MIAGASAGEALNNRIRVRINNISFIKYLSVLNVYRFSTSEFVDDENKGVFVRFVK